MPIPLVPTLAAMFPEPVEPTIEQQRMRDFVPRADFILSEFGFDSFLDRDF